MHDPPFRVLREGKERRRKWAEKLTPKPVQEEESIEDSKEIESQEEFRDNKGMLPDEIVKLLAAREKYVMLLPPLFLPLMLCFLACSS